MQALAMRQITKTTNQSTTITKYEILEAFFRTEDENNYIMAKQINELIANFYDQERLLKRNINELTVDSEQYKAVIDYLDKYHIAK